MTITEIFSKQYLFDSTPSPQSKLYIPLIVVFSLMIVCAILFKLVGRRSKVKSIGDLFLKPFLVGGILGFVYLFARYEQLAWLGSRFFLVIVLAGSIIWAIISFVLTVMSLPKVMKEISTEEKYQKYLPKRKS